MSSAATPSSSRGIAAFEAGGGYFASEAHYESVARRIIGALHGGGSFVLVTANPPASPQLLSRALGRSIASSHAVIDLRCGPELNPEAVRRAASVVARLPASSAAQPTPEPLEPAAPLFVFDDVEQLSDRQIEEICEAIQNGDRPVAAGVLLSSPGFLPRLEGPALQFLTDALAGTFRFEDIGQDEGLDYLRHQLADRHRNAGMRRAPRRLIIPAVTTLALLALATAGIAAFWGLDIIGGNGERPGPSPDGRSLTREASTPRPKPTAPATALPPATPQLAPVEEAVLAPAMSAPAQPPVTPPAPSPRSVKAPAPRPVSRAETAARMAQTASPRSTSAAAHPAVTPPASSPPSVTAPVPPPVSRAETAALEFEAAPAHATTALARPAVAPPAPAPPSVKAPPPRLVSTSEIAVLVARGDDFLASRDIGSARLFYERAATAGDGRAALRLGVTFDPGFLGPAGITGIPGDPERAAAWYRRARDLGETAAVDRLKSLEEHPPAAPDATHAARVSGAAPGRLNPSAAKR